MTRFNKCICKYWWEHYLMTLFCPSLLLYIISSSFIRFYGNKATCDLVIFEKCKCQAVLYPLWW